VKMNNPRFVILTGHQKDYPLSDLVGILRHQRKTGRLLIEYAKGPAILFFHEGDLVDAKVNNLSGLQAICFALGQPPASFNFNPLIQPTQRTIEKSLQRTVSELFGCWDETNVQIEAGPVAIPLLEAAPNVSQPALPAYQVERLALPAAPISSRRPVSFFVMAAAALATLGVSTVIALSGGFRSGTNVSRTSVGEKSKFETNGDLATSAPGSLLTKNALESLIRSRSQTNRATARKNDKPLEARSASTSSESRGREGQQPSNANSQAQAVTVVMEIEGGRVLRASIANPKPGMDSYEAMALRIARQRRYPAQQNGRETVKIKVSPPEQ
jgi:hypothetical protein